MNARLSFFRSMAAASAVAVVSAIAAGSACATDDPVVAKVDDVAIYASDLDYAAQALGKDPKEFDTPTLRDALATYLTDTILLGRKAQKEGVADDAQVKRRLQLAQYRVLTDKFLQMTAQAAATETAVRRAYDQAKEKAGPPPIEYKLRAIVLKFKDANDKADVEAARVRAEAVQARLARGEDFAGVANATTESVTAKDNGGTLGYLTEVAMGRDFAAVVTKLEPGQISPIIRSPIGWHIVKLEDKRTQPPIDFEAVRDAYAQLVAKQAHFELISKLRAGAKIEPIKVDRPAPAAPAE